MRNKKSLLSLCLLALVLVLGVGYAVVSNVGLTLGGTAGVANAVLDVQITDVQAVSSLGASSSMKFNHTTSNANLNDSFTITDMVLNEEITVTYTVKNFETDVDATLAVKEALTNSNTAHFTVTSEITDNTTKLADNPKDDTMTVVVKVKLTKTPVADTDGSTEVTLKLEATPTEA